MSAQLAHIGALAVEFEDMRAELAASTCTGGGEPYVNCLDWAADDEPVCAGCEISRGILEKRDAVSRRLRKAIAEYRRSRRAEQEGAPVKLLGSFEEMAAGWVEHCGGKGRFTRHHVEKWVQKVYEYGKVEAVSLVGVVICQGLQASLWHRVEAGVYEFSEVTP